MFELDYKLVLGANGAVTQSMLYEPGDEEPMVKEGTYTVEEDVITITFDGKSQTAEYKDGTITYTVFGSKIFFKK